ncbi:UNVERIFIED_CONTAM: hypothetical protein PYX00_009504 [Menopon gallinae]|uniref:SEFIR domain-containing protein n=1 Tax=Menopon gallinae TaxID=328185 RepID=A0AAW2HBK4_9NEOP
MGLEAYQQCVIILFFLTVQGTKLSQIMKCEIGESLINEDAVVECYHAKDVKERPPPDLNCMLVSCNQKIMWKMLDQNLGKIETNFYGLPSSCDFVYYEIDLEVYDGAEPVDESENCVVGSSLWKRHSKRSLKNENCSGCREGFTDCFKMYSVRFKYVYPGWYRLKVTPRVSDGSTRQSQLSHRFHVEDSVSKYIKKRLIDLNVNISLQYRDTARQLDVGIPLLVDAPPEVVGFEVKYSPNYIDLYEITRYGNGNESSIYCQLGEHLSQPVCHATSGLIDCKFYNMTEGDYKIVVRFRDDRCAMSTIWTESILDSQDPCRWDVRREYNAQPVPKETLIDSSHAEVLYSVVALAVLIFVLLVAFFLKRKRSVRRRLFDHTDSGSPRATLYNFNGQSSSSNRFNFGQLLTLTDRPKPEVLLIYTRESAPFMELMVCLRRVLDKICKCQVYDCFDPDMWNEISQDPEGWVHALIVERQAKVIIVASEVAAIRHRSLMGEYPELSYKSPHPFDNLFLYALKILRDGMDEDSYKNHFVVTFDGFTETKNVLEYFNPYARFVLPKHLSKLFEHLHDTDSTVHFDTSSRLEERYEVRQMRLKLEHLKNLKLLSQSDVQKEKLYDW